MNSLHNPHLLTKICTGDGNLRSNALIAKGIPEDATTDDISNYLEVVCQCDLLETYQHSGETTSVMVVLMEENISQKYELIMKNSKKRTIKNKHITLEAIDVPKGYFVPILPPNVDQDLLASYFQDEFGLTPEVKIYTTVHMASVMLESSIPPIWNEKHIISGQMFQIEPLLPKFHMEIIKAFLTKSQVVPQLTKAETASSNLIGHVGLVHANELSSSNMIALERYAYTCTNQAAPSTLIGQGVLAHVNQEVPNNLTGQETLPTLFSTEKPSNAYYRPTKKAQIDTETNFLRRNTESNVETKEGGRTGLTLPFLQPFTHQVSTGNLMITSIRNSEDPFRAVAMPTTLSPTGVYKNDLLSVDGPHLGRNKSFPSKNNTIPFYEEKNFANPRDLKHKWPCHNDQHHDDQLPDSEGAGSPNLSPGFVQPKPRNPAIRETDSIQAGDLILLRMSGFTYPNCKLEFRVKDKKLVVNGPADDCHQCLKEVNKKLELICIATQTISDSTFRQMKQKNVYGFSRQLFTKHKIQACLSILPGREIKVVSFSQQEADKGLEIFLSQFEEREISYDRGHFSYLDSSEYRDLKDSLQQSEEIKIYMNRDQRKISIQGEGNAVNKAYDKISEALNGQARDKGRELIYKGGQAQFLSFCCVDVFHKVQDRTRTKAIRLHWNFDKAKRELKLFLSGPKVLLADVEEEIQEIVRSYWQGEVDLGHFCKQGYELNLLTKALKRREGSKVITEFGKNNKCYVEYSIDDDSFGTLTQILKSMRKSNFTKRVPAVDEVGRRDKFVKKIGACSLEVEFGDLADAKADGIVNPLSEKRNPTESYIGRALLQKSGQQFEADFRNNDDKSSVIVTPVVNLNCKHVYHVVLRKWNQESKHHGYKTCLKTLFKLAVANGDTSLALPVLGYGRMLRYPEDFVLTNMITEIKNAAGNFQAIKIITNDRSMLVNLHKAINGEKRTCSVERFAKVINQQEESSQTFPCPVNMTLFAKSRAEGNDLRKKLNKVLCKEFLYVEETTFENISEKMLEELKIQCKGKLVYIDYSKIETNTLRVVGQKQDVIEIIKEGLTKMLERKPEKKKYDHLRGSDQFWLEFIKQPTVPMYWKIFKNGATLMDYFLSKINISTVHTHEVKPQTFAAIKNLVEKTFKPGLVGVGRDATAIRPYSQLHVTKIERVENPKLFEKYSNTRVEYARRLLNQNQKFVKLQRIPGIKKGGIITESVMDTILTSDIYHELNECYLFHGTKKEIVNKIKNEGLEPRLASDAGMFGVGAYFAETSTKADQYTDDKTQRNAQGNTMILARVLLGDMFVCNNPVSFKIAPCKHCKLDKCLNQTHFERYDSLVGEGHWLFREFVVYDKVQCYPEYVITYDRV